MTPALLADAERLAEVHARRGYDAVQLAVTVEMHRTRTTAGLTPANLHFLRRPGELSRFGPTTPTCPEDLGNRSPNCVRSRSQGQLRRCPSSSDNTPLSCPHSDHNLRGDSATEYQRRCSKIAQSGSIILASHNVPCRSLSTRGFSSVRTHFRRRNFHCLRLPDFSLITHRATSSGETCRN